MARGPVRVLLVLGFIRVSAVATLPPRPEADLADHSGARGRRAPGTLAVFDHFRGPSFLVPAALGVDMGKRSTDFVICAISIVTFTVMINVLVSKSKRRVERQSDAQPAAGGSDAGEAQPDTTMKATGGIFVKLLPAFMLIGFIALASAIVRAFPTWSTTTRVCVRLVAWPFLQVVGAGMLRQATVLGGGSDRAAKIAMAIMLSYQGKYPLAASCPRCVALPQPFPTQL